MKNLMYVLGAGLLVSHNAFADSKVYSGVSEVYMNLDKSKVIIVSSEDGRIRLSSHDVAVSQHCKVKVKQNGSKLEVNVKKGLLGQISGAHCHVDYELALPENTKLTVDIGSGSLEGTQLKAVNVSADLGSGDVDLAYVTAPHGLSFDVGAGDVKIELPSDSRVRSTLDIGSGNTHNDFSNAPDAKTSINADIGSGSIHILAR